MRALDVKDLELAFGSNLNTSILSAGPFSGTKIMLYLDRLHDLLSGGNPAPIGIEIDLTNECNLDCPHCTNADLRSAVRLDEGALLHTIMQAQILGVRSVTFTGGGEPTLSPILIKGIEMTLNLGMEAALITNGVVCPSSSLLQLVPKMTWVRISLDAYDRYSYATVHGVSGGIFDRVLKHIRLYTHSAKGGRCTVGVGYLTGEEERDEGIPEVSRLCVGMGVNYLQYRPLAYSPRDARYNPNSNLNPLLAIQKLTELSRRLVQATGVIGTDTGRHMRVLAALPRYGQASDPRGYSQCWGVYAACVIGANGDVYPCCHLRDSQYSVGSIYQTSFAKIWSDRASRELVYRSIRMDTDCVPMCKFHRHNQIVQNIVDARAACEHGSFP